MTDTTDDLIARAKMYGCDIRATHESLMLVGDLAARLREQQGEIARFREWARSVAYRTNGAASAVEKAIYSESLIMSDPDDEPSAGDFPCTR